MAIPFQEREFENFPSRAFEILKFKVCGYEVKMIPIEALKLIFSQSYDYSKVF
jgi:hypothetical protein